MPEKSPPRSPAVIRASLRCAFPRTIPILTGFLFLGMTYGIYMRVSGFSFVYPMVMALVIFGGSLEFVAVTMLLAPFAPVQTFFLALMIQSRHLFYGIAMLNRYKGLGWKRFYLIYGLCDETFSLNFAYDVPGQADRGWYFFFVTLLDHLYWVTGATLGGLIGSLFRFDTRGLDFVMTAMFVVIFLEQWRKQRRRATGLIGIGAAVLCLALFGPDTFLLPCMGLILAVLSLFRELIGRGLETEEPV